MDADKEKSFYTNFTNSHALEADSALKILLFLFSCFRSEKLACIREIRVKAFESASIRGYFF